MPNNSPVGVMSIVLQLNSASYSEAITEAQRKLDSMAGKARAAGTSTVSSMRAASATIRELNGDFAQNIRAVEAFASTTLGLGPVFQKLFPVAGALAFTAIIGEGIKKVVEMVKEANGVPRALDLGFRSMILAQKLSNDEIGLSNAKIDAQRAKLERKPINEMAIALHESYVEADKFADELQRSAETMDALMKKNQNGFFAQMFMGKGATVGVQNAVNLGQATISDLANKIALAPNDAARQQAQKELDDYKATEEKRLRGDIDLRSNGKIDRGPGVLSGSRYVAYGDPSAHGDQTANLIVERAALALMTMRDQAPKPEAPIVEPLHAKAAKATMTVADYERGARENAEIHEALTQTWTELNRQDEEAAKIAAEGAKKVEEADQRAAEAAARYAEAARAVSEETSKAALAMQDLQTRHKLQTAEISRPTAMAQIAAQHVAAYQQQLDAYAREKSALTPSDLAGGKGLEVDAKAGAVQAELNRVKMQDAWDQFESTALGGATTALQEFAAKATDAGAAVKDFLTGGINTINGAIVQDLTKPHGARSQFGAAGHEIFTSATGSLLRGAEGSILKGLGIGGKADGSSASSALWVRMAAAAGAAGAAVGTGGKAVSSGFGAFLSAFGIPGFAVGTNYVPQDMLAVLHQGEAVVPKPYNDDDAGGGSGHTFNIDARGATDPAQVRAQVMQGIREAAPHIVRGAVTAMDARSARNPSGKRF